jgi:hypothetical protein
MYYIANFSGVQPIYMWELIIPPWIRVFVVL